MKKLISHIASSFLATLFLTSQNGILAQELTNLIKTPETEIKSAKYEPEILEEINSKRDKFTKHFRMSDNSMIAVVYSDQIHYKDGEEFKEIDNTLTLENDEYKNTESPFKIRFSKDFNNKKLVSVNSEGHEVSWNYIKKNRKIIKKLKFSLKPPTKQKKTKKLFLLCRKVQCGIQQKITTMI